MPRPWGPLWPRALSPILGMPPPPRLGTRTQSSLETEVLVGLLPQPVGRPGPPAPGGKGRLGGRDGLGRRPPFPVWGLSLTPVRLPPTVVLSAGLAAISLFALSRLWARGRLNQLGLLMVVKESLLLSERKSSLL